jgi:hypothetical protein
MLHEEKFACLHCGATAVPSTKICARCLRADVISAMLTGWACLRPAERELFMRRACIRRAA